MSQLRKKIDGIAKEIADDLYGYSEKKKQLEEEIKTLTEMRDGLETEIKNVTQEIITLRNESLEESKNLNKLQAQVKAEEARVTGLVLCQENKEKELADKEHSLRELEHSLKLESMVLDEKKRSLDEREGTISSQKESFLVLDEKMRSLIGEADNKLKLVASESEKFKNLKESAETMHKEVNAELADLFLVRDEIKRREDAVFDREKEVVEKARTVAERELMMAGQEKDISEEIEKLRLIKKDVDDKERAIQAMLKEKGKR